MDELIKRYKEFSETDEVNNFVDAFSETEEIQEAVEIVRDDGAEPMILVMVMTNAYLFAKMSELNDKVTELEELVVSLSEE